MRLSVCARVRVCACVCTPRRRLLPCLIICTTAYIIYKLVANQQLGRLVEHNYTIAKLMSIDSTVLTVRASFLRTKPQASFSWTKHMLLVNQIDGYWSSTTMVSGVVPAKGPADLNRGRYSGCYPRLNATSNSRSAVDDNASGTVRVASTPGRSGTALRRLCDLEPRVGVARPLPWLFAISGWPLPNAIPGAFKVPAQPLRHPTRCALPPLRQCQEWWA